MQCGDDVKLSPRGLAANQQLLERQLDSFRIGGDELVLCDNPGAGIPTQQSIIIPRRTNFFRFFEAAHRFAQTIVSLCIL